MHLICSVSSLTEAVSTISWILYIAHAQDSPIEEPGVAGDSELLVVLVIVTGRRSFGDLRGRPRRNRRPV